MPRMTKKYSQALATARSLDVSTNGDQEALYQRLNELGYQWDSRAGEWQDLGNEPADLPTSFVRVRVWAAAELAEEIAGEIVERLRPLGLHLAEPPSNPYPCRPPKHLEARVYLTFIPEQFLNQDALTLAELERGEQ